MPYLLLFRNKLEKRGNGTDVRFTSGALISQPRSA